MQKTDNYHMTKINDVIRYWSDIIHTIHFCDVIGQFIITSSIAIKMANLMWCFVVKIRTFKKFVCQRFLPDTSHRYQQVVNLLMIKMSVLIFLPLLKFLKSRSAQSRRVQNDYLEHDCFHSEWFNGLVYMYVFSDLILLVALHPR